MDFVVDFRELDTYRLARKLSLAVFEISTRFPREEKYALIDQVRRSSRSVGAQMAEAWGKRRYEKHFISKLTDANAEQLETQHWLETARDCHYLDEKELVNLICEYEQLGSMINSMISKSHLFCKKSSK